jgi:hypothetical protein
VLRPSVSSTSSSEAAAPRPAPARAIAALAVGATLTVAALLALAWSARGWLEGPLRDAGAPERGVLAAIEEWRGRRDPTPRAVLFGDSLTQCGGRLTVGTALDRTLRQRGRPQTFLTLWGAAFGPLQHYYLLDDVLAGSPRLAIVEVNLARAGLAELAPHLRYLGLSRKLTLRRALRVRQALAAEGVTLFDPFLYRLEERLGILYLVPGVQARWQEWLDAAGAAASRALRLRTVGVDARQVRQMWFDAARARRVFGGVGTSPLDRVLGELGRALRAAGVQVLFYVAPVDVERLDRLGVREALALPARIEALRAVAGAAPEEWLDLHALLPGDAFKDWVGHLRLPACDRVAAALADGLGARPPAAGSGTRP